jgi:hypothetical protein
MHGAKTISSSSLNIKAVAQKCYKLTAPTDTFQRDYS